MAFLGFLQGAGRQLNPFDNNATFKNKQGAGSASVATQAKNATIGVAKSTVAPFAWLGNVTIANPAREIAATATGNRQAYASAERSQVAATNPRVAASNLAQVGLTFLTPGVGKLAASGVAKLGVEGAAKKIATNAATGAALGAPFNAAAAYGGPQAPTPQEALKSALIGGAAGAVLGGGGTAAGKLAKESPRVAKQIDEKAFTPRVSLNDQYTLRDLSDHLAHATTLSPGELSTTIAKAREIGRRNGVNLATGSPDERLQKVNLLLDTVSQRNKGMNTGGYVSAGAIEKPQPENIIKIPIGDTHLSVTRDEIKGLIKAETPDQVKNIIGNSLPQDVTDKVAPAIAQTKDPNIIANILSKELQPKVAELGGARADASAQSTYEQARNTGDKTGMETAKANMSPETVSGLGESIGAKPRYNPVTKKIEMVSAETVAPQPKTNALDEVLTAVGGTKGAAVQREKQNALLSAERGKRFATSQQAGSKLEGSAGYFAQKSKLKGEYSQNAEFTPLIHDIGEQRAEQIFTAARKQINNTPDSVYNVDYAKYGLDKPLHPEGARLNTQTAVRKVLGLEPGIPTNSEIKLLYVHSPRLAEAVKQAIPAHRRILDAASVLFGSARSIKSSVDLSMGGRQGLFVAARHPAEWAKANVESVKYAKSGAYYAKSMNDLHNDEWGKLIDKYNPSVLTGGGSHEEAYANTEITTGKLAKKAGVGYLIAGSERAYTGGLTKLRHDVLEKAFRAYGSSAQEVEAKLGKKGMDGLIEAVSTLTGRGGKKGGFVTKHATTLQETLFSPRLWASRLQPLNPAFWKRIGPAGRKEALQNYGSFAAVAGLVLSAAVVAGAEVETDPRSSDFLKIKVGDSRYDILGGFQQNLVFLARELTGSTKSSMSGKVTQFGSGYGSPTRLSAAFDLARNKANPILGSAANLLEGQDKAGNKINPVTEIGQLFVPISLQGTYQSIQHEKSIPKGIAKNAPDIFGVSTQTYGVQDVKPTTNQQTYLDNLKKSGASQKEIDASKTFFQTLKVGPDRTKASDDINKAIASGDVSKAETIADQYNKLLSGNLTKWRQQYGQYRTNAPLVKEYNKRKIKLTSAEVKARRKSIKAKALGG